MHVQVMDHPLIQHKITLMRKKETGSKDFRNLLEEITMLMGYEITRDLPLEDVEIETPVAKMIGKQISGKKLGIVRSCAPAWAWYRHAQPYPRRLKSATSASTVIRRRWNRSNTTASCPM